MALISNRRISVGEENFFILAIREFSLGDTSHPAAKKDAYSYVGEGAKGLLEEIIQRHLQQER